MKANLLEVPEKNIITEIQKENGKAPWSKARTTRGRGVRQVNLAWLEVFKKDTSAAPVVPTTSHPDRGHSRNRKQLLPEIAGWRDRNAKSIGEGNEGGGGGKRD